MNRPTLHNFVPFLAPLLTADKREIRAQIAYGTSFNFVRNSLRLEKESYLKKRVL